MSPEIDNRSKLLDLKANNSKQRQNKGQEKGTVQVETDNFTQMADRNGQGGLWGTQDHLTRGRGDTGTEDHWTQGRGNALRQAKGRRGHGDRSARCEELLGARSLQVPGSNLDTLKHRYVDTVLPGMTLV